MWFRILLALWSIAFVALLGLLATHQSSEPQVLGRYSSGYFKLLLGVGALVTVGVLAQWSVLYRRLYTVRGEIVLTIVSIVIALIMGEVGTRVLDPLGISYYEEAGRYHLDKMPDPALVYKHRPGLRRTYQGVEVSINEFGQRDRPLEKKQDGELRILLLGDSVTFGWGVSVEGTFGRKLESMLALKLGRPVRTVNTGVGSYNTVQEEAVLRIYADVIRPDVVLLLYVGNDIEPNHPPFDPWSELSLQGKEPYEALTILLGKSWLYRLGRFFYLYSFANVPAALNTNASGVVESMDALSAIATFCREHGIPFATFFYRGGGPLNGLASVLFSKIQSLGQKSSFPVGDVGWDKTDVGSMTNSTVDVHPNERGHEVMAAQLVDFLMTHDLVNKTAGAS